MSMKNFFELKVFMAHFHASFLRKNTKKNSVHQQILNLHQFSYKYH